MDKDPTEKMSLVLWHRVKTAEQNKPNRSFDYALTVKTH